jgi:hypothetical protein
MIAARRHTLVILLVMLAALPLKHANAEPLKKPAVAMLLCLVPGGGQFYTERYIPGIAIGSAEVTIGYFAYKYHQDGKDEERNSMLWWGLFVFGYSLADAYVGAKMYGFDIETDIDKVGISYSFTW